MSKIRKCVEKSIKTFLSPTYILILLASFGFWYVSKLRYTYKADVPVYLHVEGSNLRIKCVVEGTGYRILAHRFFPGSRMIMSQDELQISPSPLNNGYYIIDKLSLQNAISRRTNDVRILSVGDVPEIIIEK